MTNIKFTNGYALLIGVGDDLPVTVKDATALHDVLIDSSRAAYPPEQVKLLTETGATRKNILDAFDTLIEQVKDNAEATVICYFSGHGVQITPADTPSEYFLVPYHYDSSKRAETGISGLEFTTKIEAIKARKLVVFLDCCHAGGVPAFKEPGVTKSVPLSPDLLRMLDTGTGRVIIASSRSNEYSYIGKPYSIFTACLMEALAGKAAVEKDGFAHIFDVLSYVIKQVPQRAPGPQNPLLNRADDLDNFPLCYYAGGSKNVPGEVPQPETVTKLNDRQRKRLEERRNLLLSDRTISIERLKRVRRAWRIQTSPSIEYQLEMEVGDIEEAILLLDAELDSIEQKLF